jgi:hypothetical protein
MPIIRGTCPKCGDLEIPPENVNGLVIEYPDASRLYQYRFRCPIDSLVVIKTVGDGIGSSVTDVLQAKGIEIIPIAMSKSDNPGEDIELFRKMRAEETDWVIDLETTDALDVAMRALSDQFSDGGNQPGL